MGDRRVFSVVEVPVVAHKDDILRYEEVYDLVKKRKFVYQGGQRSLSKWLCFWYLGYKLDVFRSFPFEWAPTDCILDSVPDLIVFDTI